MRRSRRNATPVARRKSRKTSRRLAIVVLFIATPLVVWFLAFVVWLHWSDIVLNLTPVKEAAKPALQGAAKDNRREAPVPPGGKPPREEISEEERKELDAIIRNR